MVVGGRRHRCLSWSWEGVKRNPIYGIETGRRLVIGRYGEGEKARREAYIEGEGRTCR